MLFVEGQGSVLHPAYSGVTLGLIHGSAPHAYVLCHVAGQTVVDGDERFPIPPLWELVDAARAAQPARPAGEGVRDRPQHAPPRRGRARQAIEETAAETGLPADDPVRFGPARLFDAFAPLLQG